MYGEGSDPDDDNDTPSEKQFHSIIYTPSGYTEGLHRWVPDDLTPEGLTLFRDLLGEVAMFDQKLDSRFPGIRIRYHTDGNIGVADFFLNGVFLSSSALLRGHDPVEETTLITSLVGVARDLQKAEGFEQTSFQEVLSAKERPLHACFVWAYMPDEMAQSATLTNHLAGAFLWEFDV